METVEGIGGFFFRSQDPEALSRWYAEHLGVSLDSGPWYQRSGPTVFEPFKADTEYFGRPDQQWMINFRVRDLGALISQLESRGIEVETREEWDSVIGRFARIHDPEGNPIELWEPPGDENEASEE